ncbi:flagellar biosynthesis protein FlgJ [Paraburkholderia hayleyella]|uniref:flagellar biosynthesis protein FlgJ n=1 Tax=Paraburkholderia hayleyella TaxID=2152889 RepID=UPI001291E09C|nr:flagellar biosynthesis protein FlgJ [Paraburkholderia hayleyella]
MLVTPLDPMALAQASASTPLELVRGNAGTRADPQDPAYRRQVEQAAEQFEGMFINQMLNAMQQANQTFKDANGADTTSDSMLAYANRAVADSIASQRAFGIADCLIAQMLPPADPAPSSSSTESES